ncbi:MAG: V-type ATP synthase subunit E family protein [Candidatus Bathyarchaeota archaeon]|nr:V-type ATP synthase subunit E family protein [Candidatus Bathyarchaeota archaeon]
MTTARIKEGLSAIAKGVLDDVQREVESIIVNAENEGKKALGAAKAEADEIYATTVTEASVRAEAEKRKIQSVIDVETRNQLLQTKELMVDAAFDKATEQIKEFVKTEQYHNVLIEFIREAVEKVGSRRAVLHVNSVDRTWLAPRLGDLSKKLNVDLKLAEDEEEFIGGCRVEANDGRTAYDNTLENRIEQLKSTLRLEAAKILFGKEATENAS